MLEAKHRIAIIFHPLGEKKFTTKYLGGEYTLVDSIVADHSTLHIVYKEDGKIVGRSYCNMPYSLELFD